MTMPTFQQINSETQRGSALIAVLWTSILIAMLLIGSLATVRIEARSVRARADAVLARAAVHSGLELAAWRLSTGEFRKLSELASAPPIEINGFVVSVSPSKESQLIDINLANEQTLIGLFVLLGQEGNNAQQLAARIADWRDRDDLARPNGAEHQDYINASNGEAIGNRYFQSVDELTQVLDFPIELYDCAQHTLTTMGDSGIADNVLLNELYGSGINQASISRSTQLGTSSRSTRSGSRYSITVTAIGPNNHVTSLTGLFRVTGGTEQPFEYISVYPTYNRPSQNKLPNECQIEIRD